MQPATDDDRLLRLDARQRRARAARARSSSPAAPAIAVSMSPTWRRSRARRCITGRRRWRRSSAPGRRWRWSAPAIPPGQAAVYLAGQVAKVWMIVARPQPRRQHVALSGRAHYGDAEYRDPDRDAGDGAGGQRRQSGDGPLAQPRDPARRRRARSATCSCSSAPIPIPTGWPAPVSRSTTRALFAPVAMSKIRSKPACPASSRSATCARVRSSGWRRRSARAPRWSPRCMRFWPQSTNLK